jgi:hypothetical protein
MKKFNCFEDKNIIVCSILFENVKNIDEIINMISNQKINDVCLIDPSMIISEFHLLTSINKSFHTKKTKNIYSEILYNLSPSKNVKYY